MFWVSSILYWVHCILVSYGLGLGLGSCDRFVNCLRNGGVDANQCFSAS